MKKILLFSAICIAAVSNVAKAQWATWAADSVNMAPSITNDVFYSLDNSTIKTEAGNNWILAFGTAFSTAGIWANHTAGVRVFRTGKNVSQWATITLADTALEQLFNPDTSWDYGALNAKAASTYDYGWGKYNTTLHNVYGDSIFIVAQANNYYQIAIDSMKGTTNDYYTRIAPVGTPAFTASYVFSKAPKYTASNFIYVKAGSMGLSDTTREPANNTWDILFTKYITRVPTGPGVFTAYPVKGVLGNRGTKTARVVGIPVNDVAATYASIPLNTTINNIGYDWKFFTGTMYTYPDSLSYLVESKGGSLWQIKFTGYSSATGIIKFNKRKLGAPTAITDVKNAVTSFGVYPNPVSNTATIALNSTKQTNGVLSLIDVQGKIVMQKNIQITNGLNAFELNLNNIQNGNYIMSIKGAGLSASQIITKQ